MKKFIVLLLIGILATYQLNAHVELVYPQGGETFSQGEKVTIEWQIIVQHNTRNWDLYFSDDGGSTWDPIQLDMSVGILSYQWLVPNMSTTQGRIKIVQDNSESDYDDTSQDFTITTTTAIRKQVTTNETKVYPNPFINSATLSFYNPGSESHTLILFNVQGGTVRKIIHITSDTFTIERENLKSGLYFFQLTNDKGFRHTGKLTLK